MQRTLLLMLVAASYLLVAGARPWTLGPLVALALAAALTTPSRSNRFPLSHRSLDLALLAIVAGLLIQLVPLPAFVVNTVSPHAARLKTALQYSQGTDSSGWTALSIDPEGTLYALGTLAIGILSFWAARSVFSVPGNTRASCRLLAVFGALVAIAAVLQKAATPRLILFVVQPEARSALPFGAFTNRNQFAAWLLLVATACLGYLVARLRTRPSHDHRWRGVLKHFMASGAVMTALAALLTIGVMLLTLSRSALAALGVAALTGWHFGRPRMSIERTSVPTLLGAVGTVALIAVVFIDIDGWATRIEESFTAEGLFGRITIWRETLPIIRDFWLTGTGAGTYPIAMADYQQTRLWVASMQRWAHFNNAHSHYVQLAAEGGLLLLVPVAAAVITFGQLVGRVLPADKGEMFWVRLGAAAGLAGLAAQSIWEVSLTMPAVAVLAGFLAGLLLYQRESSAAAMTPEFFAPDPITSTLA